MNFRKTWVQPWEEFFSVPGGNSSRRFQGCRKFVQLSVPEHVQTLGFCEADGGFSYTLLEDRGSGVSFGQQDGGMDVFIKTKRGKEFFLRLFLANPELADRKWRCCCCCFINLLRKEPHFLHTCCLAPAMVQLCYPPGCLSKEILEYSPDFNSGFVIVVVCFPFTYLSIIFQISFSLHNEFPIPGSDT